MEMDTPESNISDVSSYWANNNMQGIQGWETKMIYKHLRFKVK